jgi:hypothetical protein
MRGPSLEIAALQRPQNLERAHVFREKIRRNRRFAVGVVIS